MSADAKRESPKPLFVRFERVLIENPHDTIRPSILLRSSTKPGAMVAVRPVGSEKTYLGMYLCCAPTSVFGEQRGEDLVLRMSEHTNPAIYVPELDRIVWGYGSWWGEIESEEKLREITDDVIENQWYVRALKQLSEGADT